MNRYEYKGEMRTVRELAQIAGITEASFRDRIRRGFSVEESLKEMPTHESIKAFIEVSWYEDYIGYSVDYLYKIYWLWSLEQNYSPQGKQGFSRQYFSHFPMLKIIPSKHGNKWVRIIRRKEVKL